MGLYLQKDGDISKGDSTLRLDIRNSNGQNLFLDDSTDDYLLGQAINGEGGCELVLEYMGWSFAFGQENYNWNNMWFVLQQYDSNNFTWINTDSGLCKDYNGSASGNSLDAICNYWGGDAAFLGYNVDEASAGKYVLNPYWIVVALP